MRNRCVITGAGGQLGRELLEVAAVTGAAWDVVGLSRADLDVTDREAVLQTVFAVSPDVILHTGAFTAVDACESEPDRAMAVNALGTRHVAEAARLCGAHVCYISTDYVFDGTKDSPYHEWDEPHPLSVYGASKLAGERELDHSATVIRSSWISGAGGKNIVGTILRLASEPGTLRFVDDQIGSPTFTEDLAAAVWRIGTGRHPGVVHVTNQGTTSWYGFARAVLEIAGEDPGRVEPVSTDQLDPPRAAVRPANSVLDNAVLRLEGGPLLPDWRDGLARLVKDMVG